MPSHFVVFARVNAVLTVVLALSVCARTARPALGQSEADQSQTKRHDTNRPAKKSPAGPQCETKGEEKIVISCSYRSAPAASTKDERYSRISLNRAVISFRPDDSSNMIAKLTFTNTGTTQIPDSRTVYLEVDDDAGNNYIRRELPSVDFRKLVPGKAVTFTEELRVSAFPPGHYTIALWIPSSGAALKFSPTHNLLISSAGVADSQKGLNILAKFTVAQRPR